MSGSNFYRELIRSVALLSAGLLLAGAAFALDPNRAMSQYLQDHWGSAQGLPRAPVYAISQAADGYLYIGTGAGLVRFDGTRFREVKGYSADFTVGSVHEMIADKSGCLWLRLENLRLLRYCEGSLQGTSATQGDSTAASALNRTNLGDVLIAEPRKGARAFREGSFRLLAAAGDLSRTPVSAVAQTPNGDVWMGTREAGVFRFRQGGSSPLLNGLAGSKINCLLAAGDGDLWIGTDDGIVHWNGARFVDAQLPGPQRHFQALSMTKDRDGNLWVGTDSRGLLRFSSRGVTGLHEGNGAPEAVTALFEDREGDLWIGSASGLTRLRDSAFVTYSLPEGLPAGGSSPVFADSENRVWFSGVAGGLWWTKDGRHGRVASEGLNNDVVYSITGRGGELWVGRQHGGLTRLSFDKESVHAKSYTQKDGLAQNSVFSVYETPNGTVWAGTLSGGSSEFRQGKFTTYAIAEGLASNTISAMLETRDGTMWFATPSGLSAKSKGGSKIYNRRDGLPSLNASCLMEDSRGVLWVGTVGGIAFGGLQGFRVPVAVPSQLREPVLGIAEDHFGWLWLSTVSHVLRVRRDKLMSGLLADEDLREFGLADGLRGVEGVRRNRSVAADPLGRIWFSLNRGISFVDPARLDRNSVPSMIHLLSISADNNPIPLAKTVHIPGGSKRIDLDFIGLSLSSPDRVRFRYRRDGFDADWSYPSGKQEASYTNLAPREYRFRVIASNPDGVWSGNEAAVILSVDALFWQTWWFALLAGLGCAIAVTAIYRMRLHQITRQLNVRFDERLAERTRLARDLHDTLLQTIQGSKMVADDGLEDPADPERAWRALERVAKWLGQATEEGRATLAALRSSTTQRNDLAEAFERAGADCVFRKPIQFGLTVEGKARNLHPIVRDEIYRIGYEAIRNACQHSQGTAVKVELTYSRDLALRVRDNGIGITQELILKGKEGHYGVMGMRERAEHIGARLQFISSETGTEVELIVPGNLIYGKS